MADNKLELTLNPKQLITLYKKLKNYEDAKNTLNKTSVEEIINKLFTDSTGMMFDSWCNGINVMN